MKKLLKKLTFELKGLKYNTFLKVLKEQSHKKVYEFLTLV
jgi:hypothetical protein